MDRYGSAQATETSSAILSPLRYYKALSLFDYPSNLFRDWRGSNALFLSTKNAKTFRPAEDAKFF